METSTSVPHIAISDALITAEEQLTPAWLTTVLHRAGALPRGEVVALEIATEQQFVSNLFYLRPTYSPDSPRTVPRRLFLKSTRPDRPKKFSRGDGPAYQWLAPERDRLPMIVHCYDAGHSPALQRAHALLDDVSATHAQPAWPFPTAEQRRGIAHATAQFHAVWWEHPDLGTRIPFTHFPQSHLDSGADEEGFLRFVATLRATHPRVLAAAGDLLPLDAREELAQMLDGLPGLWRRYLAERVRTHRNLTLTQGDAHWWQFLCPRDTQHGQVYMIDLEFMAIGIPAFDIANRVIGHQDQEQRTRYEQEIITSYLAALWSWGVTSYDRAQFLLDYRLAVALYLLEPLYMNTPDYLERNERWGLDSGPKGWIDDFHRRLQAYRDWRCADLLTS